MPAVDVLSLDARRSLLEVLACMSAADGIVGDVERDAFRGACVALGMPEHALPEVLAQAPADLGAVPLAHLTARESMLTYCAAAWMVLADAVQLESESRSLELLRERLHIEPETARFLAAHARWVRTSTDRPWHRELDHLISELARRVDKIEAHRDAA
jgi:hypothetical protein